MIVVLAMTAGHHMAARSPIEATSEELAEHGINCQSDDLFTGCSTATGARVHFGLSRLTDETLPFWRQYRLSAFTVADLLTSLATKAELSADRLDVAALTQEYGWSRERITRVVAEMRQSSLGGKKLFRSVKGGVTGIEWLLDQDFAPTEDRFVAYAASAPVAARPSSPMNDREDKSSEQIRFHQQTYSSLLLTVGVATEHPLPTVTHFGIFRNPLSFFEAGAGQRGLAMHLHGFAATVALRAWEGKVFMTTNPMPRMQEILSRSIAPEDMFVGDSDDAVREWINQSLPSGAAPIADSRRFSFAGFTLGAHSMAVKLEALSPYYQPDLDDLNLSPGTER